MKYKMFLSYTLVLLGLEKKKALWQNRHPLHTPYERDCLQWEDYVS